VKKLEVLGSVVLPVAERVHARSQAMAGLHEGRRVELSGHVQRVSDAGSFIRMILKHTTGTFSVLMPRQVRG